MRLDQCYGFIDATKTSPFSSQQGHDIITYKRRKLCQQTMKISHQAFLSNGTHVVDVQARVVCNWRCVIEQIVQSAGLGHDCGVRSCIEMALSCGPLGFLDKIKIEDKLSKDGHKGHQKFQCESQGYNSSPSACLTSVQENEEVILHEFENWSKDQRDADCITTKCQNVLFDVLTSQKFALLCDLLCESFHGSKAKIIVDLSLVISKMKDGVYKQSLELFDQDIRLVWENFQKLGQEMSCLASSLLNSSQVSFQNQNVHQTVVKEKNTGDFDTISWFTCCNRGHSTKDEQTDSSYLDKVSICKQCSIEAHGRSCLICDGCEAMFHITCIKPAVQEINIRNWYCAACAQKRKSSEPGMAANHLKCRHRNCVVCHRLEDLESQGYYEKPVVGFADSSSMECSVSDMESDDLLEPARTAVLQLCKQCGTCEEEDKRFMICSNSECLYKYYHIQCLKKSQMASQHQPPDRWYCPSCLCRACLTDRDDELICICDGCDDGYHTYCMNPPRVTIPEGSWYCFNCNLVRIRKGMRMFEQSLLHKHGQDDVKLANGVKRSMDILVNAAEKLSTEEKLVKAIRRGR